MKNALITTSFALLLAAGCIGCQSQSEFHQAFVAPIQRAHNQRVYDRAEALAVDVEFLWQGDYRFRGTMLYETDSMRSKLIATDGTIMIYDGEQAYVSDPAAATPEARYKLVAMPYFLAGPFMLMDRGVVLTQPGDGTMPFYGVRTPAAILRHEMDDEKMSPEAMVLYRNRQSGLLEAIGDVRTGPDHEKVLHPRSIIYRDFVDVDGVTLASTWEFYPWSAAEGPKGGLLGRAKLSNFRFVIPVEDAFEPPADAAAVPMPKK